MPSRVRTLVLSGGLVLLSLQRQAVASYAHGEIVETWHSELGEWRPATYVSSVQDGHFVARLDDGVVPSLPESQVRKATPFSALEAVQMLDEKSLSWVTATVLANGTNPGQYVLDVPGYGILETVSSLVIRRVPSYEIGDKIRWKHMESNYWVEGTVSSVGDGPNPFYNVMLKGHGEVPTPPALLKKFEHFKPGEPVQMYMSDTKSWMDSCEIKDKAQEDDMFEVVLPDGQITKQSGGFLRRQKKKPAGAFGTKLYGGQTVEFVDALTNTWTPGKVLKPGDGKTYTLIVPMMGEKANVPENLVRPRDFEIKNETHVEVLETRSGVWYKGYIVNTTEDHGLYDVGFPGWTIWYGVPEVRVRVYASPLAGERMEVYDLGMQTWAPCDVLGSEVDGENKTFSLWVQGTGKMDKVSEWALRRVGRVPRAGYY